MPTKSFNEKIICSDLNEIFFGYVSEDFKDFFFFRNFEKNVEKNIR